MTHVFQPLVGGFCDINGGNIDGTVIGSASATTGAFTTLSASSTVTLSDAAQTAWGVAYLNGSKQVTTGSALTYASGIFSVDAAGASDPEIRVKNGTGVTQNWGIGTDATKRLYIYDWTAGAYALKIASGAVTLETNSTGLGVGTSPSYTLHAATSDSASHVAAGVMSPSLSTGNFSQLYLGKGASSNQCGTFTYTYDSGTPANSNIAIGLYGSSYSMRIDGNGNVGIGTSPSYRVHSIDNIVAGPGNAAGQGHVFAYSGGAADRSPLLSLNRATTGEWTFWQNTSGSLGVAVNPSSKTDANLASATKIYVDTSGNVGIGGAPASYTQLNVIGSNATAAVRSTATTEYAQIWAQASNFDSTPTYTGTSIFQYGIDAAGDYITGLAKAKLGGILFQNVNNCYIGTNSGVALIFATASVERMRVTSTGLGIGVSPSFALHLNSGQVAVPDGTAGAPSYSFASSGNSDNGMYLSDANEVSISTAGTKRLTVTSDGRLYGTALHNNAGSVTGTTNQYIASGTGTPTVTAVTNITSTTGTVCRWIRVGNVVTVSGYLEIFPTSAASTSFRVALPIASNFSSNEDLSGVAMIAYSGGPILSLFQGDTANDEAYCVFTAASTGSHKVRYTYTYPVL